MPQLKVCFLSFFLFIMVVSTFGREKLTIITENWAPLNYSQDGLIKGPAVDVVRAIMTHLNLNSKIIMIPWKRGYSYTLNKNNQVLFSAARTPERELLFKWVGPVATNKFFLYAKKDSLIKLTTLDDAKHMRIGVQRAGITGELLKVRGFTKLMEVTSSRQNAAKLLRNRIDFMVESSSTFLDTVKKNKMNKNDFRVVFPIKVLPMYIVFSKTTNEDVIIKWQKAYDDLYKRGIVKEIFKKHDALELYWNKQ